MSVVTSPIVSVIIPSYNHAHFIGRALQSVLDQTYINWEAIIIDNHSQDNTDKIVADFVDSRITLLKVHNNGVIAASRNVGIRVAKGRWVAFLDSDDWWMPRKLELSIEALMSGADLVYHDLYIAKSVGQSVFKQRINSTNPKQPMFVELLCEGMSLPNSSVVVRRDLLDKIGGETESRDLVTVEDFDTWIRLSRLTEKFTRISDCLGYYWVGGGNSSSASPAQCARISALYNQYVDELNAVNRSRSVGFLAYRVGRIAQMYGDKARSKKNLQIALCSPINFKYRLKAVYFLMHNILSRLFK